MYVENKPEKVKLDSYISTGPIKTTPLEVNSKTEQKPSLNYKDGVTAIVAVAKAGPKFGLNKKAKTKSSSKKVTRKIIRILLDSGSDGDLMFHKKGTPKSFPLGRYQELGARQMGTSPQKERVV